MQRRIAARAALLHRSTSVHTLCSRAQICISGSTLQPCRDLQLCTLDPMHRSVDAASDGQERLALSCSLEMYCFDARCHFPGCHSCLDVWGVGEVWIASSVSVFHKVARALRAAKLPVCYFLTWLFQMPFPSTYCLPPHCISMDLWSLSLCVDAQP